MYLFYVKIYALLFLYFYTLFAPLFFFLSFFFLFFFLLLVLSFRYDEWKGDTWIYQLNGSCAVSMNGADQTNSQQLLEGCGGVVPPITPFELIHEKKGKRTAEKIFFVFDFDFVFVVD